MSHPVPLSFSTLLTTTWPEDILIQGGLLSRGDTLLIGAESKAGKSTLLSSLIRELMTGGTFLGFKVTRPLSILYLQAELREARLQQRLLPTYRGVTPAILERSHIWNTRGVLLFGRDTDLILEWVSKLKPDVLLIDPLVNFHTYDENNATEMSKLTRILDLIKLEQNLSLILSHHFGKLGAKKPTDSLLERLRGSSALRGWVDTTIVMEGRHGKSEYRRLEFDTRNSDEPIRRLIKYNMKTKDFDWHDPVSDIYEMLTHKMNGQTLPTAGVIQLILSECGHLVSRNRTKAFEIKEILVQTNLLQAEEGEGKTIMLSLSA